jgi:hypothetical protein|tara:strand:- start:599 stop:793 length:195 start_codon:yes stop_codon:yes gene_type:complete
MATQGDKINKLNLEVELIKKDISIIKNNHLTHIQADIRKINFVLWSVGFAVFANLIILVRDIIG